VYFEIRPEFKDKESTVLSFGKPVLKIKRPPAAKKSLITNTRAASVYGPEQREIRSRAKVKRPEKARVIDLVAVAVQCECVGRNFVGTANVTQ
jgi:hypothetical protein